jgi:integrase
MKVDPYKHKERYLKWKENVSNYGISEVSKDNSEIIIKYLTDMEFGLNISTSNKKGSRSYIRLNTLRQRLVFMTKQFEERYNIQDITKISEFQLHDYFSGMRNGIIKRQDGSLYKSVADYVKVFKAFWHWWQKINRKRKIDIEDITIDLDTSRNKPRWVYLDENQLKTLYNHAKYEYKALIMFLFDTGIRAPTELINIRISDFINDFKELNIRDEVSKTFGRRIKLMICSDVLKEYVKTCGFKGDDYLFPLNPLVVNQYLKRLAKRIFGEGKSLAGQRYSDLTMYDFRHISCCYWLPRYKSEAALKFRFGWKKSDKIHYYSEMLGMRDTIQEEDLLVDVTKTELEKRLTHAEHKNELLESQVTDIKRQLEEINNHLNKITGNMVILENVS